MEIEMFLSFLPYVLGTLAIVVLLAILASGYVKAPPDQAYIISGLGKKHKILIGKAGIKIPFLERLITISGMAVFLHSRYGILV